MQAVSLLLGKPVLDGDILSLDPSKLAQLLPERLQEDRATRSSAWIQETYAEDFPCLLRVGHRPAQREVRQRRQKPSAFYFGFWIADFGLSERESGSLSIFEEREDRF